MSIRNTDITVVGGGIAGLSAAITLAQRGAKVTVLEQAESLGEVGAGLQISPNGVAVLEAMGLLEEAAKVANVPEAVELRDMANGKTVAHLPMGAAAKQRWGWPYWQFHRADLLGVLSEGARTAGVDIRLGQTVTKLSDVGEASVVIAADGVRSALRGELFDGQPASFTGQVAWRGLIAAANLPEGFVKNAATVYMGPKRHLVTYPLRGGSVINFVAVEERDSWAEEGWNIPDTPENLRHAFANAGTEVQTILAAVDQTFLWGLFNHPYLPNWTKNNVAMIGDACHPMLPFLAQGAVMALEDAWVLARELDRADDIPSGLLAYERLCKPRATRVQKGAASNATAYHLPNGPAKFVAHKGLKALSTLAPATLLGRFDWLYGGDVTKSSV